MTSFLKKVALPLLSYAKPHFSRHPQIKHSIVAALRGIRRSNAAKRIRQSGFFDEAYYVSQHPVVRDLGLDPVAHYLRHGAGNCSEPSPQLSMQAYLAENPDVRERGLNPLLHYIDHGKSENRSVRTDIGDARWLNAHGHWLPDSVVQLEKMAGIAFFARFGFSFAQDSMRWIAEATECLEIREPRLEIEPITPDVTIVIPVYGQLPFTLGALDSLSRQTSQYSVEIIVCDDASPAETQAERLRAIPWIRYLRRDTNGGFIDACNWAAERARGGHIVFLNSDTRVVDGWLDELISTFSTFPTAGLVGSKLFNEDLSLQEAGGIFWSDGSCWNYGRNEDPNQPSFCYARRVDFCSGAAIAIRSDLWREIGGFDPVYRPAYCEDVDIAFQIRALGYETWFQPLARVIHYEGKTHGRDVTAGIKAYQIKNLKTCAARWSSELAKHANNGPSPNEQANRSAGQSMLVIDAVYPAPDMDSGSLVTMQMIQSYQELGFQIAFVSQSNYAFHPKLSAQLQRSGVECLYAPFFFDILGVLNRPRTYDITLVYRVSVATQVFDALREKLPCTPIMFHNIDLHYLREFREAVLQNDNAGLRRAAETQRQELAIIARADCAIVISPTESKEIQVQMPRPLNTIVEMPIFVNVNTSDVDFQERRDIIFLAGFGHAPNIDAAEFFVRDVWPLLLSRLPPDSRLLLVGSNPTESVKALATERIVVTGYVPDLKPWFDRARIFVAPLRFGAGIKGKVIQSLAHGTPTVITSIAAEGIGLELGRHTRIADQPSQFAGEIMTLYSNEDLWKQMQQVGYDFVATNLSHDTGVKLCQRAVEVAHTAWMQRSTILRRHELTDILANGSGVAFGEPSCDPRSVT